MAETETLEFHGTLGDRLTGRLHLPPGRPEAYALFAHCFTCSKDLKSAVRISTALAERGIATLRFDFTGLGESEGDFAESNFSSNVEDLTRAADMLRERFEAPRILIGHSLGGAAVLAAAHEIPEAAAVATIGAPYDPAHVRALIDPQAPDLEAEGEAEVSLAGRHFRIKKQFLDDLESQQSRQTVSRLNKPLLLMHSPQDRIVDIDNARLLYQTARHPKSFISLDGADHLLQRRSDAEYVAVVLAAWARRYLPEPHAETDLQEGQVEVTGGPHGFANQVRAGSHRFAADEPESVPGGSDTGPSPYDLLLAGLGACTSMTLRMYANRKQWPLQGVRVRLQHRRIHARDCEDCETGQGQIDEIDRVIRIDGPLDEEQRQRLLEIANKCPVHRTLTSENKVRSRLESDDET
jgi:putative redox protein